MLDQQCFVLVSKTHDTRALFILAYHLSVRPTTCSVHRLGRQGVAVTYSASMLASIGIISIARCTEYSLQTARSERKSSMDVGNTSQKKSFTVIWTGTVAAERSLDFLRALSAAPVRHVRHPYGVTI